MNKKEECTFTFEESSTNKKFFLLKKKIVRDMIVKSQTFLRSE